LALAFFLLCDTGCNGHNVQPAEIEAGICVVLIHLTSIGKHIRSGKGQQCSGLYLGAGVHAEADTDNEVFHDEMQVQDGLQFTLEDNVWPRQFDGEVDGGRVLSAAKRQIKRR
jgi:hypothetical protein